MDLRHRHPRQPGLDRQRAFRSNIRRPAERLSQQLFPQPRIADIDIKLNAGFRIEDWTWGATMTLRAGKKRARAMYLVDTNVVSESRKRMRANAGVRDFFNRLATEQTPVFLSVVTVGELRRSVELIRHRGDNPQANRLERWVVPLLHHYQDYILDIDSDIAQLWGRLRVPYYENPLDKLIAATALIHDLTVVTRNRGDFAKTGVRVLDPFS